MGKLNQIVCSTAISLALTACIAQQPPAKVVDKGGMIYARSHTTVVDTRYEAYQLASNNTRNRLESKQSVAAIIEPLEVRELAPPQPIKSQKNNMTQRVVKTTPPSMLAPLDTIVAAAEQHTPLSASLDAPATALSNISPTSDTQFIWPVQGRIISGFGPKKNGLVNDGVNISAIEGEPIWSAADGKIVYAGNELKGYGNMVIIRHTGDWMTAYAHASALHVKKGDRIKQGDIVGFVGKTGNVSEAQLHFGIRQGKTPIDPTTKLPQQLASN